MSLASVDRYYENLDARSPLTRYQGIPMVCEPGLHERVAMLAEATLPASARSLLDVGCGQGALSLRLADRGFDVDALDMYDRCQCKDRVRFQRATVETAQFDRRFDAITLVEVLEHLESPFAVLRRCVEWLKPGARLFVTTPNVDSDFSRAWFMLRGHHWYFDEHRRANDGHITPVHDFQLREFCERAGLEMEHHEGALENRVPGRAHGVVMSMLKAYQRVSGAPRREGRIAIYVLRKPA